MLQTAIFKDQEPELTLVYVVYNEQRLEKIN